MNISLDVENQKIINMLEDDNMLLPLRQKHIFTFNPTLSNFDYQLLKYLPISVYSAENLKLKFCNYIRIENIKTINKGEYLDIILININGKKYIQLFEVLIFNIFHLSSDNSIKYLYSDKKLNWRNTATDMRLIKKNFTVQIRFSQDNTLNDLEKIFKCPYPNTKLYFEEVDTIPKIEGKTDAESFYLSMTNFLNIDSILNNI